jgi:hypothetical protein
MSLIGPSRHIAPPRDLSRYRSIAEVEGRPTTGAGDAIDPIRTLGSVILAELFVPCLGQYEVFWISLGSYNVLRSCSSRRDVPMSPFHVDGRRGMPSAGIELPIKTDSSFVPVSHRALAVRTGA